MTMTALKGYDLSSFRGEFTVGELIAAAANETQPFFVRTRIRIEIAGSPPINCDEIEHFSGSMNYASLRAQFKTMAGFARHIVGIAVTTAQTRGFTRGVLCNMKLSINYQADAPMAVFAYDVALMKESF